jgi:site-specific DNA recombinase
MFDQLDSAVQEDGMKVALYARLSKDRSGISENVDIQVRECKAHARSQGWRIVGIWTDNDISASRYSKKVRPGYQALLTAIQRGNIEAIVITEMPRLYRRLDELLELMRMAERTSLKHIIALDEAGYDLSTGQGVHNAVSAVNNAMLESRRTSDRQKRRIRAKAQEGIPHGGRRAFGYEPGGQMLREDEAEIVRWMVERLLGGGSVHGLVAALNDKGIKTVSGRHWEHTLVRQVLESPRLAGIRAHNGSRYPGNFPAIISIEQWEMVQLALARLRRTYTGGNQKEARKYLLTGLIVCGHCEQPMVGHAHQGGSSKHKRPRYACSNPKCRKSYRIAEPVDLLVRQTVLYRLNTEGLATFLKTERPDETRALHIQYQQLQARQRDLVDDYASGLLSRAELAQAKATIQTRIEQVLGELSKNQTTTSINLPPGQTLEEAWEDETLTWRQSLLRLVVRRVVVKPGRVGAAHLWERWRFDPDSISIEMKA